MYRLHTVRVGLPPLRNRRDFVQAARLTLQAVDPTATLADSAIGWQARWRRRWPGFA